MKTSVEISALRFKLVNRSPGYAVARLCCIAVTGASRAQAGDSGGSPSDQRECVTVVGFSNSILIPL